MSVPAPGGGGDLIFSYIRRLRPFFGSKFEFQYLFIFYFFFCLGGGGVRKMIYFWDRRFCGYFGGGGGRHKIGLVLGVISMYLGPFLNVNVHNLG